MFTWNFKGSAVKGDLSVEASVKDPTELEVDSMYDKAVKSALKSERERLIREYLEDILNPEGYVEEYKKFVEIEGVRNETDKVRADILREKYPKLDINYEWKLGAYVLRLPSEFTEDALVKYLLSKIEEVDQEPGV